MMPVVPSDDRQPRTGGAADFAHRPNRPDQSEKLRDAGQQESLDIARRLDVAEADQGLDQRGHFGAGNLAGAIEEICSW